MYARLHLWENRAIITDADAEHETIVQSMNSACEIRKQIRSLPLTKISLLHLLV